MRFTASVLLSALVPGALTAAAAVVAPREDKVTVYDAIIVGGGPAGLSALSGLARVRRNVLLIDSGEYRNQPTRHMHDVIGFDGVTPAYYRWAAREQLAHYDTVSWTNGTVTSITAEANNTSFRVNAGGPDDYRTFVARKIVLATGLRDLLPDTPGLVENWGQGIYWCPWCDGHEHADQALGIMADLTDIPGAVREILTLNTDIVAFANGTDTPAARAATEASFPGWERFLQLHNVTVANGTLASITRLRDGYTGEEDPSLPSIPQHDLFRLNFTDPADAPIEREALFVSFPEEQRSNVGRDMGVTLYGNGRLAVDPTRGLVTNIPGVYAIGDANSDNVTNVPHALFSGKRTAVYLHVQLAREESAAELAKPDNSTLRHRDVHETARSLWDEMNGQPGDILYAGGFDQSL
jgi:thioredoxin reductase